MANEAFSLKSASVRWAGWASVTYGRVGTLKTRVGKQENFFGALRRIFAHPGLKPCWRPCVNDTQAYSAITHTREYRVLPGVVRYTFIILGLFTKPNLCPPDTKKTGDAMRAHLVL